VVADPPARKPNVLWIIVDDMSPNFSCNGEARIRTPHVDRAGDGSAPPSITAGTLRLSYLAL
jgi:hypothetical protein